MEGSTKINPMGRACLTGAPCPESILVAGGLFGPSVAQLNGQGRSLHPSTAALQELLSWGGVGAEGGFCRAASSRRATHAAKKQCKRST